MKQVTLYSTKRCPRCKLLAAWLAAQGIAYESKDLEDAEVITELRLAGHFSLSAPQLDLGGTFLETSDIFLASGKIDQTALRTALSI